MLILSISGNLTGRNDLNIHLPAFSSGHSTDCIAFFGICNIEIKVLVVVKEVTIDLFLETEGAIHKTCFETISHAIERRNMGLLGRSCRLNCRNAELSACYQD